MTDSFLTLIHRVLCLVKIKVNLDMKEAIATNL